MVYEELAMRKQARTYESSGTLELRWVDRKLARQERSAKKTLKALCIEWHGHREYHVRVRLCTGTQFTDVQPTDDPDVFTGRRYPAKVLQGEPCGAHSTFRISKVASFYVCNKREGIRR